MEPPNAGNADEDLQVLWCRWLDDHLPTADPFRVLLSAPGVTAADVIADPVGFPSLLDTVWSTRAAAPHDPAA